MCISVFSYGCIKFCLVILEDYHTSWQIIQNYDASKKKSFFKTSKLATVYENGACYLF